MYCRIMTTFLPSIQRISVTFCHSHNNEKYVQTLPNALWGSNCLWLRRIVLKTACEALFKANSPMNAIKSWIPMPDRTSPWGKLQIKVYNGWGKHISLTNIYTKCIFSNNQVFHLHLLISKKFTWYLCSNSSY